MPIILPLLILAAFYVLMLRPQQRRIRAHQAVVANLSVGDEIVTAGGLFGRVTAMREDSVLVEIAPGVVVRLLRTMISQRLPTADGEEAEAGAEDGDAGAGAGYDADPGPAGPSTAEPEDRPPLGGDSP